MRPLRPACSLLCERARIIRQTIAFLNGQSIFLAKHLHNAFAQSNRPMNEQGARYFFLSGIPIWRCLGKWLLQYRGASLFRRAGFKHFPCHVLPVTPSKGWLRVPLPLGWPCMHCHGAAASNPEIEGCRDGKRGGLAQAVPHCVALRRLICVVVRKGKMIIFRAEYLHRIYPCQAILNQIVSMSGWL